MRKAWPFVAALAGGNAAAPRRGRTPDLDSGPPPPGRSLARSRDQRRGPPGAPPASPWSLGWRQREAADTGGGVPMFVGDAFPPGWPLDGMAGPGSHAVEEPPTPRLPVLAPPRRFVTISAGLAALERAHHNLRRALAGAVAEHLRRAAELLRQRPSADMLLLGAARTAEVIDALDLGARSLDLVGMPLLEHHVTTLDPKLLDGVAVLYVNHLISDSLMVARALARLGAKLTTITIPYSGIHGPVQRAVHHGFKHLGPTFLPRVSHPSEFPAAMAVAVRRAITQLTDDLPDGGRWMIVEDGGYAFPALHDDPTLQPHLATCLGAIEHTTRGKLNDQYQETDATPKVLRRLRRPAVTIAGSALKTVHEGGFVAQALVDECGVLLRKDHQFLRHRQAVVVGYGRIGRALARALAAVDADVVVADPSITAADTAFPVTSLAEALRGGVFLVFGATGIPSMTPTELGVFRSQRGGGHDTLYLASASSKQIEFSNLIAFFQQTRTNPTLLRVVTGHDGRVLCELDPGVGLRYRVEFGDGTVKTVVLLGCGYPVLFFPPDTHGAPNRAMDPVMTQLLLAACGLPYGHTSLDHRVYTIDDLRVLAQTTAPATATPAPTAALPTPWRALVDERGLLVRWCQLNRLDPKRYLDRIGFTRPADGRVEDAVPPAPAVAATGGRLS